MLIAISGSQGSGKSTLLNYLKNLGYIVIERKTSRSVLNDFGIELSDVTNNSELLIKYQNEILKRKFEDEYETIDKNPDELIFTERTYADLFTYTIFSGGKDNKNSEWINEYYKKCLHYQQIYNLVYYINGGFFNIENDGVRSVNYHYGKMTDLCMKQYTIEMTHPSKFNIINTPNIEERITLITNQINNF